MKSFFLSGILFLSSLGALFAQENASDITLKDSLSPKEYSPYFLNFGLNVLDNGNSKLPFNADEWSITNPFFVSLERRSAASNFSAVLSFSTNKLKVNGTDTFYYSIDAGARYYFDDLIFNNADIEMYAGVGLGRFFLQNSGNNTLNVSGGGRYWFSKHFALSVEAIGKAGLKPMNESVLSHYAYNVGIVWRTYSKHKTEEAKIEESPIALEETLLKGTEEVAAIVPIVLPTIEDYPGEWYMHISYAENASVIYEHSLHSIYRTSEDDNTMWINDFNKGVWIQCKIRINTEDSTFYAEVQPNVNDRGTVTITEGRIEKGAGVSKSGTVVDKIYFKAEFSYDPGKILNYEGIRNTGLNEDKY